MKIFDYYAAIIPEKHRWASVCQHALPTCFWTNTLKISAEGLQQFLHEDGCVITPIAWRSSAFRTTMPAFGKRWEYVTGLFQIQEEVSMLPVIFLDPQPGERVLDLCAAPGNKTAEMSVRMQNRGTILANDRNYNRLRALGQISKRLGLMNISTSIYDGRQYPRLENAFDKVLVDAPCSGEGTFRKRLSKIIEPNLKNSLRLQNLQIALLKKAIRLCKPGGRIIYSTCTFAPEENEAVITAILKSQGDRVNVIPVQLPNFRFAPGVTEWRDATYEPAVKNTLRIWPHLNNTGGFYIAVLEKMGDDIASPVSVVQSTASKNIPDYLRLISERFGISNETLEKYDFTDDTHRGIYIKNTDNQPPSNINIDATGLFFIKTKIRFPKLSTAAAMLFGKHATKNNISVTREQRDQYLQKNDFTLTEEQIKQCSDTGYVILQYKNHPIGVGLYFQANPNRPPILRSLFPKHLSQTI